MGQINVQKSSSHVHINHLKTLFGEKYDPAELIPGLITRVEHSAVVGHHTKPRKRCARNAL